MKQAFLSLLRLESTKGIDQEFRSDLARPRSAGTIPCILAPIMKRPRPLTFDGSTSPGLSLQGLRRSHAMRQFGSRANPKGEQDVLTEHQGEIFCSRGECQKSSWTPKASSGGHWLHKSSWTPKAFGGGHWLKVRQLNLSPRELNSFHILRARSDGPIPKAEVLSFCSPIARVEPGHRVLRMCEERYGSAAALEHWEVDPFTGVCFVVQWVSKVKMDALTRSPGGRLEEISTIRLVD